MAFILYKGIAWTRRFTSTDDDTGERSDLTGLTITATVKRRSSEAALLTLTVGDGITLLDQEVPATAGQFDLTIPGEDSADLNVAAHVFAIIIDGDVAYPPKKLPVNAV